MINKLKMLNERFTYNISKKSSGEHLLMAILSFILLNIILFSMNQLMNIYAVVLGVPALLMVYTFVKSVDAIKEGSDYV